MRQEIRRLLQVAIFASLVVVNHANPLGRFFMMKPRDPGTSGEGQQRNRNPFSRFFMMMKKSKELDEDDSKMEKFRRGNPLKRFFVMTKSEGSQDEVKHAGEKLPDSSTTDKSEISSMKGISKRSKKESPAPKTLSSPPSRKEKEEDGAKDKDVVQSKREPTVPKESMTQKGLKSSTEGEQAKEEESRRQSKIKDFLDFLLSYEIIAFALALEGAIHVRKDRNKKKELNWFHAFGLTVMMAYGNAFFGHLWVAEPSTMLWNDLNMGTCVLAFVLVNYTPFDIGYRFLTQPPSMATTLIFARMYETLEIMHGTSHGFSLFKAKPTPYYPIPVFGPILFGTMLINMRGFVMQGFPGYVKGGMPALFRDGLVSCTFYHFFVHDTTGPIGNFLRTSIPLSSFLGIDDATTAYVVVVAYMQASGLDHFEF